MQKIAKTTELYMFVQLITEYKQLYKQIDTGEDATF